MHSQGFYAVELASFHFDQPRQTGFCICLWPCLGFWSWFKKQCTLCWYWKERISKWC